MIMSAHHDILHKAKKQILILSFILASAIQIFRLGWQLHPLTI